jgi:hypothetical protein
VLTFDIHQRSLLCSPFHEQESSYRAIKDSCIRRGSRCCDPRLSCLSIWPMDSFQSPVKTQSKSLEMTASRAETPLPSSRPSNSYYAACISPPASSSPVLVSTGSKHITAEVHTTLPSYLASPKFSSPARNAAVMMDARKAQSASNCSSPSQSHGSLLVSRSFVSPTKRKQLSERVNKENTPPVLAKSKFTKSDVAPLVDLADELQVDIFNSDLEDDAAAHCEVERLRNSSKKGAASVNKKKKKKKGLLTCFQLYFFSVV